MDKTKLTDIVLGSIKYANIIAKGNVEIISSGSCASARDAIEKGRQKAKNYGGLAKFVNKSVSSLRKKKTGNEEFPDCSRYSMKAQSYINELRNYYNQSGDSLIYLKDFKSYLVEAHSTDFETAYSAMIRTEKGMKKYAIGSTIGTIGAMAATAAFPCIPLASLSLGLLAATGVFAYQLYDTRKSLKANKEMMKEDLNAKKEIEGVSLKELDEVLQEKRAEIRQILGGQ